MHHKERQAALLVILAVLIIFSIGLGVLWYINSKTPKAVLSVSNLSVTPAAPENPVPTVTSSDASPSFGGHPIRLEFAATTQMQEKGLGGRASVPDDYGMLFIFQDYGSYGFWMKDMKVPLDIFWLSDSGSVVTMKTNLAASTYPEVFYPSVPVRYVLETRAGYAAVNGIHLGSTLVGLPLPSTVSK